jgi:hypothetical protein
MIKDLYGNTRFYGVYRGVVYQNSDPQGKGRLRLKIPQVLADQVTDWAWPVETPGVETQTPLPGQGVWVMFEGGDLSYPIWIGQFGDAVKRSTPAVGLITTASIKTESFEPNTLDTLDTNYGAFQYLGNQTSTVTTAQAFPWDTLDYAKGVYTSNTSRIYFRTAGLYNLNWSGQFENSSNEIQNMTVWLRINGVDVPGSSGFITISARKNDNTPARSIVGWNYFLKFEAGQYLEFMWHSSSTSVTLNSYAAGTAPTHPTTAALIFTASQVA